VYNESNITYFVLSYYLLQAVVIVSVRVEFYNRTSSDSFLIQNQCCVQIIIIISASTRHLYRRKLSQLLEGIRGHEQEPLQDTDEMQKELTHPVRMDGSIGESKPEYPRARTSLSHIRPSYSHSGEALGYSSSSLSDTYYSPPREQRKDDLRPCSPLSSSYLGAMRGLQNDEVNNEASSSWLSRDLNSSVARPSTSTPRRMYGSSIDDSFGRTQSFGTSRHTVFPQVTEENPGYSARQRSIFSGTLIS
jgi:hypothetical protein